MPRRDYFAPGGSRSLVDNAGPRGVYSQHPAGSPKFNTGNRVGDTDTLARLFLLTPLDEYDRLMKDSDTSEGAKQTLRSLGVVPEGDSNRKFVGGTGIIDFLLTGFSLQQSEQVQVSEVLADAYAAYYFGQSAPRAQLTGVLFNTRQDNWFDRWYHIYQEWIRGTRLASRRQQVVLKVDSRYYFGSMFNLQTQFNAQYETMVNFSMGMLVKRIAVNQQASQVNIVTNTRRAAALSTQFTEQVTKKTDAVEVQQDQAEAVNKEKKVEVSSARNTVVGPVRTEVIDAEGQVVFVDGIPYTQAEVAGNEALQERYQSQGVSEGDLGKLHNDMQDVGDPPPTHPSYEPRGNFSVEELTTQSSISGPGEEVLETEFAEQTISGGASF